MNGAKIVVGRRVPTPMPPSLESHSRKTPKLVCEDSFYRLSIQEQEALIAVKIMAPKMDRNGYFFYPTSTAKKKKINLMQPKLPRMAFEEKCARKPGVAVRISPITPDDIASSLASAARYEQVHPTMNRSAYQRVKNTAQVSQLECYQPRYHTIRDVTEKKVSEYSDSVVKNQRLRRGKGDGSPRHQVKEHAVNLRKLRGNSIVVVNLAEWK